MATHFSNFSNVLPLLLLVFCGTIVQIIGGKNHLSVYDEWFSMHHDEALNYYTAHELCRIANNDALELKIGELCKLVPGNLGDCQSTVHPGALMRHRSISPQSHHLVDLVKAMRLHGSNTIFLIGDSVTRQHFDDALCSLTRDGLNPRRCANVPPYAACAEQSLSNVPRDQEVIHGLELIDLADNLGGIFRVIMHHWGDNSITALKQQLSSSWIQGVALIVFNFGLHANSEAQMQDLIEAKLPHMISLAQEMKHVVVFRETTAQHFPTPTGLFGDFKYEDFFNNRDYDNTISFVSTRASKLQLAPPLAPSMRIVGPDTVPGMNFDCQPIVSEDALIAQNYRNRMAKHALSKMDPQGLVDTVSFYNITAGRPDYHRGSFGDCTHYAEGSMLWAPVWQDLYSIYLTRTIKMNM